MPLIARIIVTLSAVWLLALGLAALVIPDRLSTFLRRFASSPGTHYLEQSARLVAGAAFVVLAPTMRFPIAFAVFGWTIVITAVALMILPWRWHRRFAEWSVPMILGQLRLFSVACLALGCLVLAG